MVSWKVKARYPHFPSASVQKGVGVKNHSQITSLQDFVPGSRLSTTVPQVDTLYTQNGVEKLLFFQCPWDLFHPVLRVSSEMLLPPHPYQELRPALQLGRGDHSSNLSAGTSWTSPAAAAKSPQSCPTLCDPTDGSPPGSPVLGFSRQEHWRGLPFPSPVRESEKWKWSRLVVPDS